MKPITLKEFNAYAKTCSEENLHLLWEFLTYLSFNNDKRVVCQNNTLIINVKMEFIRNDRQSEDLLCKELVFKDMHFMQDVSIDKVDDLILHIDNNVVFKNFLIKSIYEEETKGSINNLWIYKDFKCEEFIIMNYRIVSFVLSAHHIYGNLTFNECEYENFCYYFAEFHKFNFYGKILFLSCIFKNNAAFMNSIFHNRIDFKKSKFYTNAYFNNAIFKETADFHECEFEKVACFYGVTFEKTPNFSQAIFEGNVNLVNAKLGFDFENVEINIKETHKAYNQEKQKNKPLEYFANDFRDSFRLFKNALIKDNNLLDASQWHKLELYCKEIELDSKISNAQASVKELIDSCVLKFYRHTSDHHTDLLKIWHTLLILIGIFGILSGGVVIGFDYCCLKAWDWNAHTLIELYNTYIKHFVLTHTICALIINLLLFVLFVGLFLAMILNQVNEMIGKIFTILRLVSIALCCFVIIFAFAYLLRLCIPECMLIYCMIFIFIVVLLVMARFAYCKRIIKGARNLFIGASYFITIFILISSPKYLIPAIGIFTDKRVMFDPLSIVGGVYTILFGFILYSFIKTARKNSIVPH